MTRSRGSAVIAAVLTFAAPSWAAPSWAAAAAGPPAANAANAAEAAKAASCGSLAGRTAGNAADHGTVTAAQTVNIRLTAKTVAFCDVKGVITPQTKFEMLLPVANWHGQYVQEGCSTLCGSVALSHYPEAGYNCTAVDNGEMALATDDEGHSGGSSDGSWARKSPLLRIVYGLTSEHSLYLMSRAIVTTYYGRPAVFRYYDGCSTGGREGLMLAQRYPADFNGIIAGAPAMNMAPLSGLLNPWLVRSNTAADGHQIVPAEVIPALHTAVIRACADSRGIIDDPRRCGFNPASIACRRDEPADSCLTREQVKAVRAFYRGPVDGHGRSLYNGGEPYGSELGWIGEFVERASDRAAPADGPTAKLALSYLKDMAFEPNPPASLSLADVKFTAREFRALGVLGNALYNANDPDLHAFAALGGKLIMYHGWADQAIPPWSTLDYYGAVEHAMGGFAASQSFSRLYMIPGAYHCLFAPDGDVNFADFLASLVAWVQNGNAPGAIEADTVTRKGAVVQHLTVRPYDALAPVHPAPGSLNGHYRYIGTY